VSDGWSQPHNVFLISKSSVGPGCPYPRALTPVRTCSRHLARADAAPNIRAAHEQNPARRRSKGQGRETGERMQEVASNFKGALDKSVRDQPMATLATAAMVGFVLGALWKS
jgi:ElaB/YqjD/DUF883 family membrane-anchored ribosome-binding protein